MVCEAMTLEDFFTLTEMTDGLTAPSRVQELVTVIQKEKDCAVKNIGDAIRQWAAVASTIAATENKDCLDLFIKLDGLYFIDRWLKDAQSLGNDTSDDFVEESITALLRALEKLQIDKERSFSSGIWTTVNNLLDHNSSRIQDRARTLSDSWKQDAVGDAIDHDVQRVGASQDASVPTNEIWRTDAEGSTDAENNAVEPAREGIMQLTSSTSLQQPQNEDARTQIHNTEGDTSPILDHGDVKDGSTDPLTAVAISKSDQDSSPLKETCPMIIEEGTNSTDKPIFPVPMGNNVECGSDSPMQLSKYSDKSGVIVSSSGKVEGGAASSDEVASCQEIVTEPTLKKNVDANEGDFGINNMTSSSALKAGVGVAGAMNMQVFKSMAKDGECRPDTLQDLSAYDSRSENRDDSRSPFSKMDDIGAGDGDRTHFSDEADDSRDSIDYSRPGMDTQSPEPVDRSRSDIDLEYGIVDALEVARQVAQEVEREVVDYKEPSCSSSSEKILASGARQPGTPDSINRRQDQPDEAPQEDLLMGHRSSGAYFQGHANNSDNVDNEAENGTLESSQLTEVAQEPEVNTEKGLCDFDLNQEVCSEDIDRPGNPISTPVSVVSASRPAGASGSPSAPLQFEGRLGWKGSAATSAFRPASPRKASDGDKILETGETSTSSKQRQGFLDFDLNVAEGADEKTTDLIPEIPVPVSSGLPSGESSLEMGPRRSERPNLDLNRLSDDGDTPLELKMGMQLFYPRNGHCSPSPASSSSSMQPSLRNFDLNDRPLFHSDSSEHRICHVKSSQNVSNYEESKPDDPVISLMGTKVEVGGGRLELGKKDFIHRALSLPNGKPMEPAMDSVARMGSVLGMVPTVSYTHSPVFGYNRLTTAPSIPISSSIYGNSGPISYMVESGGAPVVPQFLSCPSTVPSSLSHTPFIMSMTTGTPLSLNGAGPSRPNLDLNSGFGIDGGSTGGLRQFFLPGPGRSVEEHTRANSRPSSSSGVGEKRKGPDGGWGEPYSLQYKHPQAQPPWR